MAYYTNVDDGTTMNPALISISISLYSSSSELLIRNSSMNSSTALASVDDYTFLAELNRRKALLLAPAILYTVLAMLLGTVGNPVAIYIYGWRWPKTTTRFFLLWLACIDLLNCLITMPTEIYFLSNFYYAPKGNFCRLSRFFTYFINNSTSAVFLAIALDRYIRICHPHRSPMSIIGAKVACVLSLVVGAAVSWPAFFLYGQKIVHLPTDTNKRGYVRGVMCSIRNDMDKTPYPFAFFIYLCCGVSVCFLILSVFYILIGRVILKRRRAKEKRNEARVTERMALHNDQQTSGGQVNPMETEHMLMSNIANVANEHQSGDVHCLNIGLRGNGCADITPMKWSSKRMRPPKSTLMLFAITAIFVICFLPFLIIIIIRQHYGSSFYPSLSPIMEVVVNIFSRSYLVNNCTNPIVYGLCNSQFSAEVRKIFRIQRPRRNSSLSRKESNGDGLPVSE